MNQFAVQVLGASSAAPAHGRNQTAQLLLVNSRQYLIDCGEGTQHQFFRYKIRPYRLNHIFISHLHGDHYLGLVGLLSTLHLQKREHPLTVYGPPGLEEIVQVNLKHSQTDLSFPLTFVVTNPEGEHLLLRDNKITVHSFPLSHRIPTTGFRFTEHPKPHRIIKARLPENIQLQEIARFKQGLDVLHADGTVKYAAADHTLPPKIARTYAYCSDTRYLPEVIPHIQGADLLYHEATFAKDMAERAAHTFHSTTEQAATIARDAQVRQLMIGHYSIRYRELEPLLEEARAVFAHTRLAVEGDITEIPDL